MISLNKDEFEKKQNISFQMRGSILARFAILEVGMQEFVVNNLIDGTNLKNYEGLIENIQSQIFQNTYFGYILLRNLFEKTLIKNQTLYKEYKKNYEKLLSKIYEIRNIVAHGIPEINNSYKRNLAGKIKVIPSNKSEFCIKSGHLPPPYYDETVESLYNKFNTNYDTIANFINNLPGVTDKNVMVGDFTFK